MQLGIWLGSGWDLHGDGQSHSREPILRFQTNFGLDSIGPFGVEVGPGVCVGARFSVITRVVLPVQYKLIASPSERASYFALG